MRLFCTQFETVGMDKIHGVSGQSGERKKGGLGQESRSPLFKGRAEGEKPEKESGKEQQRDRKERGFKEARRRKFQERNGRPCPMEPRDQMTCSLSVPWIQQQSNWVILVREVSGKQQGWELNRSGWQMSSKGRDMEVQTRRGGEGVQQLEGFGS